MDEFAATAFGFAPIGLIYTEDRIIRRRSGALFWCRVRGQQGSGACPVQTGRLQAD